MPRRTDSLEEAGDQLFAFAWLLAEPVEVGKDNERDPAIARAVQAPDQDRTVLPSVKTERPGSPSTARLRADHHAQGRWLANPGRTADQPIQLVA